MSGIKASKADRRTWIAVQSGILIGLVCLIVIVAEQPQRNAGPIPTANDPSSTEQNAAKTEETNIWVARRIQALGDPVYGVRARATRQLIVAGPKVVAPLTRALASKNPEIQQRTEHILTRLIRRDEDSFVALEDAAGIPNHPAAKAIERLLEQECDRRQSVLAKLTEQRRQAAHRYLREARAALYEGQFLQARKKAKAAEALGIAYDAYDDTPELVLTAVEQAESRAAVTPIPVVIAVDQE